MKGSRTVPGWAWVLLAVAGCGGGPGASPGLDLWDVARTVDTPDPGARDEDLGEGAADLWDLTDTEVGDEEGIGEVLDLPGDPGEDGWDEPTVSPLLARHLQALLDEYLLFSGEYNIALALQVPDRARWRGGAGVMDLAAGAPLPREPAFRIGSGTKPVVSTLVLRLVEEGLLGLDDPLDRWLPEYPNWKDITIRQLLGMRSGIPDYLMDTTLWIGIVANPEEPISPDRLLQYVSGLPLQFEPGSRCLYSNTNYLLAGLVAERAAGRPAADLLEDYVIRPLSLSHTYLDMGGAEDPALVHGYMDPRPAFADLGIPPGLVDLIPQELFVDDHLLDCAYLFHPSVAFTAGALVSTPSDMAVFMRALVRGEILQPGTMEAMLSFPPCRILGEATEYGLGITRGSSPLGVAYGHGGLIYGYSANTVHIPDGDVTLSYMGGAFPAQFAGIQGEVLRLVMDPPRAEPTPCGVPEGFFQEGASGERLEWRVRGGLNRPDAPEPLGAIANLTAWMGGTRYPLYGTWASAALSSEVFGDRVTVTSFGPPRGEGWIFGEALLNLDATLVQELQDGVVRDLDARDWARVVAVTMDLAGDAATQAANRVCISAVPDWSRAGRLAGCRETEEPLQTGELLRVFGSLGMTSDPGAIETYLGRLNLPRCSCLQPDGTTWAPCAPVDAVRRPGIPGRHPLDLAPRTAPPATWRPWPGS
ncbi:MAG TPA: serine hydrolase domain-containing protein [Myxococcota bacterium]|nr:serine hydrolase domain-containing protein [Myxococcota bacterium]HQK50594.1 serine hydrolase domain-containing protein [Myxococcota bacterium]